MLRTVGALTGLGRLIASHPLTRDRQLAAWLRFAKWQIDSRLSETLEVPWLEGQKLVMRRGMTAASGNIYLGLLEFMSMMLTVHLLRDEDLFLDIGANVGSYTVLASGVAGARTWAFEPDPGTCRDLARNVAVNGLGAKVVLHQVALGPEDGEVLFTSGDGAMNKVASDGDRHVQRVPQRRLDSLIGDESPIFIKLDVEGYEEQVLQGAARTLANPLLRLVALEGTSETTLRQLTENGFERGFYDPFTRVMQRQPNKLAYDNGQWTLSNEFFVRDWPFVERRLSEARPVDILGQRI